MRMKEHVRVVKSACRPLGLEWEDLPTTFRAVYRNGGGDYLITCRITGKKSTIPPSVHYYQANWFLKNRVVPLMTGATMRDDGLVELCREHFIVPIATTPI